MIHKYDLGSAYGHHATFSVACAIDTTAELRQAKEKIIKEIAEDKDCKCIGANLIAAFVRDRSVFEQAGVTWDSPVNFLELAEEWTREMMEVRG